MADESWRSRSARAVRTRHLLYLGLVFPPVYCWWTSVLKEAREASAPGDVFVLMDLDHFKQVNDTLGHAMGDQVLVTFAGVLRSAVRLNQVVARYGGEEFATILPQADDVAIERHLQNVRRAWSTLSPLVTFSSGIAARPATP